MTMTLEELRRDVQKMIDDDPLSELSGERRVVATLDAVIRERGELRGRTEKAEAELASLKKRIAEAPTLYPQPETIGISPSKVIVLNGCPVRVFLEYDDV